MGAAAVMGVLDVTAGTHPLPAGPPLHLEAPGAAQRHLAGLVLPERLARLREVAAGRTWRLSALLEDLTDPHNLAACARTADACGVQHLHLITPSGRPRKLSREVSLGTDRWVTLHPHASTGAAVDSLKGAGYLIAATDLGEAPSRLVTLDELAPSGPLVIAFGNEHGGISPELRRLADVRVRIPMYGFVESFNVSVAFALTLHALRQKLGPQGDLDSVTQTRLVDRWLTADIPRALEVLELLARREVASRGSNG